MQPNGEPNKEPNETTYVCDSCGTPVRAPVGVTAVGNAADADVTVEMRCCMECDGFMGPITIMLGNDPVKYACAVRYLSTVLDRVMNLGELNQEGDI